MTDLIFYGGITLAILGMVQQTLSAIKWQRQAEAWKAAAEKFQASAELPCCAARAAGVGVAHGSRRGAYFLIFDTPRGTYSAGRCDRLEASLVRARLQMRYPGTTILSPLERPTGPVQVVTVYLSRERSGFGRVSPLEQWGVC